MKLSMFEEEELATISSRTKLIFKFHHQFWPQEEITWTKKDIIKLEL